MCQAEADSQIRYYHAMYHLGKIRKKGKYNVRRKYQDASWLHLQQHVVKMNLIIFMPAVYMNRGLKYLAVNG